jgi:hypothetical protein
MDWIERLFHINPDAGSGSLELSIMIGAAIALMMILVGVAKVVPTMRSRFNRGDPRQVEKLTPK